MPAQMSDQGVQGMDLICQAFVLARLGCLAFQTSQLALNFGRDFRQALKIGFCTIQFQLRLMAA